MNDANISQLTSKSKIVILWSAPRCVSSAFLKAFSQRSQTTIVNEPFVDVYYFSQWRRSDRFGDCEEQHNYGITQVIEEIQSPTTPLVFMKEIAYQALPYIDQDFLKNTINTFIRAMKIKITKCHSTSQTQTTTVKNRSLCQILRKFNSKLLDILMNL